MPNRFDDLFLVGSVDFPHFWCLLSDWRSVLFLYFSVSALYSFLLHRYHLVILFLFIIWVITSLQLFRDILLATLSRFLQFVAVRESASIN